jgi:hypothetical protein
MDVEFIKPQDRRWSDLLSRADHDLYHLPEYVSIAAEHEGGEPVAVVVTDGTQTLLLPLVVRPVTIAGTRRMPSHFDAVSPYGYPHPLVISPVTWSVISPVTSAVIPRGASRRSSRTTDRHGFRPPPPAAALPR